MDERPEAVALPTPQVVKPLTKKILAKNARIFFNFQFSILNFQFSINFYLLHGLLRKQQLLYLPLGLLAVECGGGSHIGGAGCKLHGVFACCGLPFRCLVVEAGQGVGVGTEGERLALARL